MYRAGSLLRPLIRDLGIEDNIELLELKRNWNCLFSEPLSRHMAPSLFSRGELLLTVDSPVWLQQLNFCKEDILKKVASYGVRTIRFRLGKVSTKFKPAVRNKKPKSKSLTDEERTFIRETVADLRDDVLKETLKEIMGKAIASGKTKVRES